jgi:hypothetical protein
VILAAAHIVSSALGSRSPAPVSYCPERRSPMEAGEVERDRERQRDRERLREKTECVRERESGPHGRSLTVF